VIVGLVVGLGTWLAVGVMGLPPGGIRSGRRWVAHVAVAFAAPIFCGMLGGYLGLASPARIPLTCAAALHGSERSECFSPGYGGPPPSLPAVDASSPESSARRVASSLQASPFVRPLGAVTVAARPSARFTRVRAVLAPSKRKAPGGTGAFQTPDVMRARRGHRTG
jgi:hypothetical protein